MNGTQQALADTDKAVQWLMAAREALARGAEDEAQRRLQIAYNRVADALAEVTPKH